MPRPRPSSEVLVYVVIYESGKVSLEHVLLSWYPLTADVMNENPLSQPTLSLSPVKYNEFSASYERDRMRGAAASATAAALEAATKAEL